MGKPPQTPYPPDPAEQTVDPAELAKLTDVTIEGVDWANRQAFRAALLRVELRLCRLTGAQLTEATIRDVTFADCRLDLAGLRFATLERVVFRDCRMSECDLYASSLRDVVFERCDLRQATFSTSRLERVEMRACELTALAGVEALRTVRMPWNDVMANAPLFADAAGIEIID